MDDLTVNFVFGSLFVNSVKYVEPYALYLAQDIESLLEGLA